MSAADHTRSASGMDRITVRVDTQQLAEIDTRIDAGEYHNRSVAVRDLLDAGLDATGGDN